MFNRIALSLILAFSFIGAATAQSWNAEQKEIWDLEELQWKMAAAEDMSWIDTMVHPNLRYWETGDPMPRGKDSLRRWGKYAAENSTVLEQELFPISITLTGNVAVVQYNYQIARENHKKEREMVTGNYTDVLVKENGRWMFIAWAGGTDKKE